MPVGNAPAGGEGSTPVAIPPIATGPRLAKVLRNGCDSALSRKYSYGSGRASNIPKPARTAVLPLWKGSQAKPMRGSKFLRVGFLVEKLVCLITEVGPVTLHVSLAVVGAGT